MEKRAFSVLLIAVTLTLVIGLLPIHGEGAVYDSVVRLHVLASSDSEDDQALKLLVRDEILVLTEELLANSSTRAEALIIIEENLHLFRECAEAVIEKHGSGESIEVSLGKEYYPTRQYDLAAFPSGEYMSLQIKIGAAEGKNWWCVLFPPICLSAAKRADKNENSLEDAFIAAGLTGEQYRIITESENTGKYKVRFKILEIIKEIGNIFSR